MSESPNIERRSFLRSAGVGAIGAAGLAAGIGAGVPGVAGAAAPTAGRRTMDGGTGMHGTMSTAGLMATFTLNEHTAVCGVGAAALETGLIESLPGVGGIIGMLPIIGGGFSGPFAMLMYSLSVNSWDVDRASGMVRAAGQMRSITEIAGITIEDVEHPYIAVAKDTRNFGRDTVGMHFSTPFWTVGTNPLATPSDQKQGWSMFGGPLMVGEITVAQ